MTLILDGKKAQQYILEELKEEIIVLKEQWVFPWLVTILVWDNPASISYVTAKQKIAESIGIHSIGVTLPDSITQEALLTVIELYNSDPTISWILVQAPLPAHIDALRIFSSIDPKKDVDCFNPETIGRMFLWMSWLHSCTPAWVLALLQYYHITTVGKHVVIVGRSNLVGKPLASLLAMKGDTANATVTLCHSATLDLSHFTRQADILVAATGQVGMITADMVKEWVVVIDVGITRVWYAASGKALLRGDIDTEVFKKASAMTPVPGGVGPMTIAMLMKNTVYAAKCF